MQMTIPRPEKPFGVDGRQCPNGSKVAQIRKYGHSTPRWGNSSSVPVFRKINWRTCMFAFLFLVLLMSPLQSTPVSPGSNQPQNPNQAGSQGGNQNVTNSVPNEPDRSTGCLMGHVKDVQGRNVTNSIVAITDIATHHTSSTTSDNSGAYEICNLLLGDYVISAGFGSLKQSEQISISQIQMTKNIILK
jgi:hypothetical protein